MGHGYLAILEKFISIDRGRVELVFKKKTMKKVILKMSLSSLSKFQFMLLSSKPWVFRFLEKISVLTF